MIKDLKQYVANFDLLAHFLLNYKIFVTINNSRLCIFDFIMTTHLIINLNFLFIFTKIIIFKLNLYHFLSLKTFVFIFY